MNAIEALFDSESEAEEDFLGFLTLTLVNKTNDYTSFFSQVTN